MAITMNISVTEEQKSWLNSRRETGGFSSASDVVRELIRNRQEHPVEKDQMAESLAPMRSLFTKSIAATADLAAGQRLETQHVGLRKPGTGLTPDRLPEILGRKLRRPVPAGTLISEEDLE